MNVVLKMQSRSVAEAVGLGRKGKNSRLILVAEGGGGGGAECGFSGYKVRREGERGGPVDPGGRCTSLLNG